MLIKKCHDALEGMEQVARAITFGPDAHRLGQRGIRVELDNGTKRHPLVTVRIKPPRTAMFKRQFFEGRIMGILRRKRLCPDWTRVHSLGGSVRTSGQRHLDRGLGPDDGPWPEVFS